MSIARTRKVCSPTVRSVYSAGGSHSANGSASSEDSKVELGSLLPRAKFAVLLSVVAGGPKSIVVAGAVRSALSHVYVAISGSAAASGSSTRTSKVCTPIGTPLLVFGDVHG